ncbi:MAG: hypothetical protein IRZ33_10070 [Alicyclobacillaceae bacterium]|nr:hypothetical protein [Alicyclobacillaceae bacterium]
MRVSHIALDLSVQDLNSILAEWVEKVPLRIVDIDEAGIRGQVRLWWWNIDFTARPSVHNSSEIAVDISAHKLVPIPPALVHLHLREAVKDAPPGVDVIRQTLTVHLPSLLRPFGLSLAVQELRTGHGCLHIVVDNVEWAQVRRWLSPPSVSRVAPGAADHNPAAASPGS